MLAKPVTLAAGVLAVSAANAFLLPPEVSGTDAQLADAAALVAPSSAESQIVKLDCPGCPVVIHGPRGTRVIPDKPNHLELTFNVDHQPEGDRVLVNGFELLPNPVPAVLTAPQVFDWKPWHGPGGPGGRGPFGWHHRNKGGDDEHHHRGPPGGLPPFLRIDPSPLGFAMETKQSVRDPDSQLELVTVDFQIFKVADSFIEGIPEVHVKLIKDASGRLMLGNIEQSAPAPKMDGDKHEEQCSTLLCRWLKAIFPKGPSRPCHGQKHGGAGVGHNGMAAGEDARERLAAGMRHEHSWGQLFKNVASHILLPVLIGIIAGVAVSMIGMVVGTIIVSLWRTFVRRPTHHRHHRRHSSHHHKAPQKEAVVEDEKSGLMENQDLPPSYDAEDIKNADSSV